MKVLHFGDLHIWRKQMVWGEALNPKRWLGPINLLVRRAKRFPPEYRDPILQSILDADADLVIFSGDFTTLSLEDEYKEAAERFAPLLEHYGDRFFAIPGNHDRYTPETLQTRLLERYLPFAAVDRVKTTELANGLTLVGVDHSEPFKIRSNGIIRPETHEALRNTLSGIHSAGRCAVVVGHFPCLSPSDHPESWDHGLLGEEQLRALLTEFNVPLYLHGHTHIRWALHGDALPHTLCLNCGSAGMKSGTKRKQAGYLQFDLGADGLVSNLTMTSLDPDALTVVSEDLPIESV